MYPGKSGWSPVMTFDEGRTVIEVYNQYVALSTQVRVRMYVMYIYIP